MMKDFKPYLLSLGMLVFLFSCNSSKEAQEEKVKLEDQEDTVSYALGQNIASNLQGQDLGLDGDIVARGLKDAMAGKDSAVLTEEQKKSVLQTFQQKMRKRQQEEQQGQQQQSRRQGGGEEAKKNLMKSKEFLKKNKNKEGVKTTESGLQYKVLETGNGESPSSTSTVKVHYKGTLIDGSQFDSSYDRGEPAEFPVNNVIQGWQEALQMMKVGSKWKLFIPPELGYGSQGTGQIGPNEALIFEVELIEIK